MEKAAPVSRLEGACDLDPDADRVGGIHWAPALRLFGYRFPAQLEDEHGTAIGRR